jgi:hypothetical protein
MRVAHSALVAVGFMFVMGLASCSSDKTADSSDGSTAPPAAVDVATLMPADNQVTGWTVNPAGTFTQGQVVKLTTEQEATALIDGAAVPYYKPGYSAQVIAVNAYMSAEMTVDVFLVQMASDSACEQVYADFMANPTYQSYGDAAVGQGGKLYCGRGGCVLVARKKAYFVREVLSGGDTQAAQDGVVGIANAIFSKVP